MATGEDGNPLNEGELLSKSLLNNADVFPGHSVVKYDNIPLESAARLQAQVLAGGDG